MAARKPTTLQLAVPYPTDREKIWATVRALGQFTARRLEKHSGTKMATIKEYLPALIKAGHVEAINELRPGAERLYALKEDCGADAPRLRRDGTSIPPDGRTRMWQALPVLSSFNPAELAHAASLPEAPVAVREAEYYCRWLERGGYVLGGPGPRYIGVPSRRHGPKAPQVQRVKRLYDPNTGEVLHETVTPEDGKERGEA